jgi:hypothetical protein
MSPPELTLVEPVFVFDFGQVHTRDGHTVGQMQQWPSEAAPYDIATELGKVFEGVAWLPNYFAASTFPSLFGHFLTDEYQEAGFHFLESHVGDPLAPAMAAAFLHHCWMFCDRLFEEFWQRVAAAAGGSADDIPGLFVQAVASCAPYLSQWHVAVIKLLREKRGDAAALDVVLGRFLMELVRLWQWAPRRPLSARKTPRSRLRKRCPLITQTPLSFWVCSRGRSCRSTRRGTL